MALNRARRPGTVIAALAAAALVVLAVGRTSSAAFTATADTGNNGWGTGTVILTDNDSEAALFNAVADGQLDGDQTQERCITVTYAGNLGADVRLHATTSGTHARYLTLNVSEGTGSTTSDCTGFTPTETVFDGTVAGFGAAHPSFAAGAAGWQPQPEETKTYRFTITTQNSSHAQGGSGAATFVWEARTGATLPPVTVVARDEFATAPPLAFPTPGSPTVADFDLTGATFEQWELDAGLQWSGAPGTGSLWYPFTANQTTLLGVNTFAGPGITDPSCDTALQIFDGPLDQVAPNLFAYNGTAVATGDPNQTCSDQSETYFTVTAGTTYYINVQGMGVVDMTQGRVRLFIAGPPHNDDLANAELMTPLPPPQRPEDPNPSSFNIFRVSQATAEPSEPGPGDARTVWAKYVTEENAQLRIYSGAPFQMFTGGPGMTDLTAHGTTTWHPVNGGSVVLEAVAGQTYFFQISALEGQDSINFLASGHLPGSP